MHFDPDNNDQAVDGRHAAALLGVSAPTLRRLRRSGIIMAFQIPSRGRGNKIVWWYPLTALHEFVSANRNCVGNKPSQFSVEAIARLVGVSTQDIRIQKWRGRLKGTMPTRCVITC